MDNIRTHIARHLLSIGAVFLRPDEPFVWASGIKSPIYCDNRLILTAPEARNEVEQAIADTVRREYPEAQVLMGTATAGIAHAAIAAHLLGLPMGYVRSGSKDHGRRNQIEGKLTPGEKVVVIEDLISTGGSVLDTVAALRAAEGIRMSCQSGAGRHQHLHLRHGQGPPAAGRGRCQVRQPHRSGHHRSGGRPAGIHHAGRRGPAAGLPG